MTREALLQERDRLADAADDGTRLQLQRKERNAKQTQLDTLLNNRRVKLANLLECSSNGTLISHRGHEFNAKKGRGRPAQKQGSLCMICSRMIENHILYSRYIHSRELMTYTQSDTFLWMH